eukprot:COSAG04_NODE_13682_length_596_cov_0.543260_2_plen_26_part_01
MGRAGTLHRIGTRARRPDKRCQQPTL